MVYEIEFDYNGREYDYDISALDGSVVQAYNEPEHDGNGNNSHGNQDGNASVGQALPDRFIKQSCAKEIALSHAGVKATDARHVEIELDVDDGVQQYEIEFKHGKYEYSYEIDARTGKIISAEKDFDD